MPHLGVGQVSEDVRSNELQELELEMENETEMESV
jgi:hypothetical protein